MEKGFFWLELQDLYGLTFPMWCVRGDFNVIRRISEKLGDSRLTFNMRCFDKFIRESGLLDPPLKCGFYLVKHAS